MATTTGSPAAPSQPWGAGRQAGAFLRSVASVGHADAHRPTWANVGAYGWTWTRSRGGISARTRLGRAAAGTPAACAARWRRRKGRGWSASHHRRGLPRPPRYGSSAPQPRQWRGGARIARRAIVADAAAAPRTSALMCHPTGENPRKRAKLGRVHTIGRRRVLDGPDSACGDPRSAPFDELQVRQRTWVLAMSNGAPPAERGMMWSTVRSAVAWPRRAWPGHQLPCSPRHARSTRARRRRHWRVSYTALWALRVPERACAKQRPRRVVRIPQTVQTWRGTVQSVPAMVVAKPQPTACRLSRVISSYTAASMAATI